MTRAILFAAAALATIGSASLTPIRADAAITSLGDCYNTVITWCNENQPNNASECANHEGGPLDQCDEEFGNVVGGGIQALTTPGRSSKPKLRMATTAPRQSTIKR